jgi:molecular chaperone DnaJ
VGVPVPAGRSSGPFLLADDGASCAFAPLVAARRDDAPSAEGPAGDHYAVLGVAPGSSASEIKAAYRALVKRHHPDAGGDARWILALNAAWEELRDGDRRRRYDLRLGLGSGLYPEASARGSGGTAAAARGAAKPRAGKGAVAVSGEELRAWLVGVYAPLDRLLGQVINPFPAALKALSADPYDDDLMEAFCAYLEQSRQRVTRAETLYRSLACPEAARGFGLSVYHCLGQVQDAVAELERYTLGYVDSYLHDGREMLREARRRRQRLQEERRRLEL